MPKNNIDYTIGVITSVFTAFVKAPFIVKIFTFLFTFLFSIWCDLYVFLVATALLVGIDTHLAIKACIRSGGKYESKKVKNGLLEKLKLYLIFLILTITLDIVFKQFYNYEKHYFTYTIFAFVVLYEAGSIVESLNVLYPKNKGVKRLASMLNLTEKKLENGIGIEK